jgi:RNA polymerase sigma-70 factor (ECF subfamily)
MMQLLPSQPGLENSPVGRLYQRHWLAIFTAICQRISSPEEAEDILLDVFVAAMESRTLLSMSAQYQEAWLRRVAYNKCMDFHRRATRRSAVPLEEHAQTLYDEDYHSPEQATLRQEELLELREHLASLSTVQREILRLRFADELPCSRIAARLHKSEGAIRTMLSRTLNLLRGLYTPRREDYHDQSR